MLTQFYAQDLGPISEPVRRALAFQFLLENKTIFIGEGELIVGEKGSEPKATPTYPELCCHTLSDFDILDSREKIPFKVSKEARKTQADVVIPYWRGNSMRDLILR